MVMKFRTKLKKPDKKPKKLPKFQPPSKEEKASFNQEFREIWTGNTWDQSPKETGTVHAVTDATSVACLTAPRLLPTPPQGGAASAASQDENCHFGDFSTGVPTSSTIVQHYPENNNVAITNIQKPTGHTTAAVKEAAENTLTPIPPHIKKPYLTATTINLMAERQTMRDRGHWETEKQLNKKIKKSVQKDKRAHIIANLEQEEWNDVKLQRKGFVPRFTRLKNKDGNVAPSSERPHLLADYFEQKQWAKPTGPPPQSPHFRKNLLYNTTADIKTGDYELPELKTVIKKAKKRKSPGPDEAPIDLFKLLDDESLTLVLHEINTIKNNNTWPTELDEAIVVTIYKKGNVEDPSNYRPIALLNTMYKLYTAMLRNRLIKGLEDRLSRTQYGFRAKRSTTQPIFAARRLMDIAEASGDNLILLLLDWEKAFDKVDQNELINAVERFNIPSETLDELKKIYTSPLFCIRDTEGTSTYRPQGTGIRQGCPLSPYLFVTRMTALIMDAHAEAGEQRWSEASETLGDTELLYADDTPLIGSNKKSIEILLHAVENQSSRYNMNLNKAKCETLAINFKGKLRFKSGETIKNVKAATYLGATLNATGYRAEVEGRLQKANAVFNKLKTLWRNTGCTLKWKLRVFNACIMSVLLYGMEGVVLTQALTQRINYFHTRALRNIMGLDSAYMSKISNKNVLNKAREILYGDAESNNHRYLLAADQIKSRAVTLLGHIIREPNQTDHARQITIDESLNRVQKTYKRVGRPRFDWLQETMGRAYKLLIKRANKQRTRQQSTVLNIHKKKHRERIEKAAYAREFPFDKKKNRNRLKKKKKRTRQERENEPYARRGGKWESRLPKAEREKRERERRNRPRTPSPPMKILGIGKSGSTGKKPTAGGAGQMTITADGGNNRETAATNNNNRGKTPE